MDGLGHRTENVYSLYNKLTATRTAGLAPTDEPYRYFYDRLGNLTQTKDMLGNIRSYTYDQLNRLVSEQDEAGGLHQYQYDKMTNVTTSTDPNGTIASYEYTASYRIKHLSLANPNGKSKTVSYAYDEEGAMKQVDDDGVVSFYNNAESSYQPDAYDRVLKETTSINGKTFSVGYRYDVMDRLTGITYPNNKEVTYQYNALGEITGMPGYVQSGSINYEHGLVTSLTAANGVRTDYTYDENARLTGLRYSGESGNLKEYLLTYDQAGNIIQKNQDVFKYDVENRLVEAYLTGSFSVDAEKEQQAVGAVSEDVLGDRQLDFNLEEAVEDPTILSLDYNAGSIGVDLGDTYELARIELTPLAAENRVLPKHIRVFVSDDNNPKSYEEKKAFTAAYGKKGDTTILEIAFTEKVEARYVKVKTDFNERDLATFAALDLSQFKNSPDKLIKVYYRVPTRTEKYGYDLMGNRKTESVTMKRTETTTHRYYPGTNRLMTNGRWAFAYDPNGNTVAKGDTLMIDGVATKVKDATAYLDTITDSTTELPFTTENGGVYCAYEWDLLNRLVKVSKNGEDVAAYTYNWKGYRVMKVKLNAKPDEVRTTYYVFSPAGKLLYESEEKTATESADFYRQYDYLFGKLFAKDVGHITDTGTTSGETRFYQHVDHLGSLVAITGESGNLEWSNEFTPFGSAADSDNKTDGGFKWAAGHGYDEDIELVYMSARFYSPETGRFLSTDPARAGLNFYAYCSNNPLGFVDPAGLDQVTVTGDYHPENDYISQLELSWGGPMSGILGAHGYSYNRETGKIERGINPYALSMYNLFSTVDGVGNWNSTVGGVYGVDDGLMSLSDEGLSWVMSGYGKPTLGPGGTYGIDNGVNTISEEALACYIFARDPIFALTFHVPGSDESGSSLSFWSSFVTDQQFKDKRKDNVATYCNWFVTEKIFDLDQMLGMVGQEGNLYSKLFTAVPNSSQRGTHLNAGMSLMFAALQAGVTSGKLLELTPNLGFSRAASKLTETVAAIQELSNRGVLILGFYNNPGGISHVFFVSNSQLTVKSYAKVGAANPAADSNMRNTDPYQQLMVTQAGTYTGNVLIPWATNNWGSVTGTNPQNPWLTGELHFYAVIR